MKIKSLGASMLARLRSFLRGPKTHTSATADKHAIEKSLSGKVSDHLIRDLGGKP